MPAEEKDSFKVMGMTYALLGAVVGVAFAIYSFASKESGDAVFGILIAVLSALKSPQLEGSSPYQLIKASFDFLCRKSKYIVMLNAIFGSLLIIDKLYNVSFFVFPIDTLLKRLAPAFLLLNLTTVLISLYMKRISENLEVLWISTVLYISTLILNVSSFIFFLGLPIETMTELFGDKARKEPELFSYSQNPEFAKAFLALSLICIVWIIASILIRRLALLSLTHPSSTPK